jgi:asparagine synthase (glutamine-hydrolysing)
MPGATIVSGESRPPDDAIEGILESLLFRESYDQAIALREDSALIGCTCYDSYPVRHVETAEAFVLLEGKLYDTSDTEAVLEKIAGQFAADRIDAVTDQLRGADGDFLLVGYVPERDETIIVNDTFGRLPTYYATVGETTVCSRELKFLREFASMHESDLEMDRLAAAQILVFGYPLGTRTLFGNVSTIPPGSVARIGSEMSIDRYHRYDFERKRHEDRSVDENGRQLAERFAQACRRRHDEDRTQLLSLSGGLDSRAVAAAYAHEDLPLSTATFDNDAGDYENELEIAERIARTLSLDWTVYDARQRQHNEEALFDMKQGMNNLSMAFILGFFEQIDGEFDALTYVTGDGGDKTLVDLTPPKQLGSVDELVRYVVESQPRLPVSEAASIASVDEATLRQSIGDRFRSYPEDDYAQQYAHFLFRERGINWLNHGEDRNRYYFWSVTPFYARQFFEYAMNCPDEQKQYRRLYGAFLSEFEPELLKIEYPDFGAAVNTRKYRVKKFVYDQLTRFPALEEPVIKFMQDDDENAAAVADEIRAALAVSDPSPLDGENVATVVENYDRYRIYALSCLLSVTTFAQRVGSRQNSVSSELRERGVQGSQR